MTPDKQNFKDSTKLTRWTKGLLYCLIAASILGMVTNFLEYQLLRDIEKGVYFTDAKLQADAQANEFRQAIAGIISALVFIVSGVLVLIWIYRANYNARQLGEYMEYSPGWSVGWYFIPIANLWKPYQAMKEIWECSSDPNNRRAVASSKLLPWWWFLWLAWNISTNFSMRYSDQAEEIEDFINANLISQLSHVFAIPLCIILIVIIKRIHQIQTSRASG